MDRGKIFMNGKSQAVRLPKKYRFESEEVIILEHPAGVLLVDPRRRWEYLESIINNFSDDLFNEEREQLSLTEREEI